MPHTIPTAHFATLVNLACCAVASDVSDLLIVAHDITVHRAPLFELGYDFEADIGTQNVERFKGSNLAC